ncbi:aspartic peptidase domain-containing protein [Lactifluus subvellereus]|nr:aspartic peptidase domain-containing protein [Lactifluus subvellereus]
MFPLLLHVLFCLLAVLDVAWALAEPRNHSPRLLTPSLPSIVRRQAAQNVTTTNSTSGSGAATAAGIVPLTLASDKETYYSVISVGNVSFRAAFDTASSDIWVLTSACNTPQCKNLPKYPLTYASPTFVSVNNNATLFNVSFLDTTAAYGYVAEESIALGGFTAPKQAFGLMNSTNISFVDQVSGFFGLGFPRLSRIHSLVPDSTPFFAKLAQQGLLDYPFFGVSLERNASAGSLSLGAVDSTVVTDVTLIEWIEVVPFLPFGSESNASSYLQWAIPISTVTVGTKTFTLQPTYPQANADQSVALFDIGTPGIFGPYQDVERLFTAIGGSRLVDSTGQWAIPCNTNLAMTFTFSAKNYTLLPSDYIIGPTTSIPALCLAWPKASPPSADGIDWQIGSAFLRTVYTVFSYGIANKEPPLIGLYPLRQGVPVPLSPASLSALFSSLSLAVATTLPNFVLPTPTLTTPAYIFNTSVPATVVAVSDLATSAYTPLIEQVANGVTQKLSVTALPKVTPAPTLATLVLTDASGSVRTTVSPLPVSTVVLGRPPGFNSGSPTIRPHGMRGLLSVTFSCLLTFYWIFR